MRDPQQPAFTREGAVRQIAYFVPDAVAAARRHSQLYGSGPFLFVDRIRLSACRHRGRPSELDHSSAYGQWGEVMVEFVQQNDSRPSPFRDLYPDGGQGLHHVALIVPDLAVEMVRYEAGGHAEAFYGEAAPGVGFAMMDTAAAFGHMTELYEPTPGLVAFYARIKAQAGSFDGADPVRSFRFRS
jgi:hypothetical protein